MFSNFRSLWLACLIAPSSFSTFADDGIKWQFDGSYRLRYEALTGAYRADTSGSDDVVASRLMLSLKGDTGNLFGQLEVQDSRVWGDDSGTPLGTDDVNALEPIQMWLGWHDGDKAQLKIGRQSLDITSRRLIARQRYRSTIRSFDGVWGQYKLDRWQVQGFWFHPVDMKPTDRNDLHDNKFELDGFGEDIFWGMHAYRPGQTSAEMYYYQLEPDAGGSVKTAGTRINRSAKPESLFYEAEFAYQFGDDTRNRDINASMLHASIGWQSVQLMDSAIEVVFDYASGDDNPNDSSNQRFNSLFGVTRSDFGPTGIYGFQARANMISTGLKWSFTPFSSSKPYLLYRAIWLDSATDSQTRSGLRDEAGQSGKFVGHQIELRWRQGITDDLKLEVGGGYLFKGDFMQDAPLAPEDGNLGFFFTQITYSF